MAYIDKALRVGEVKPFTWKTNEINLGPYPVSYKTLPGYIIKIYAELAGLGFKRKDEILTKLTKKSVLRNPTLIDMLNGYQTSITDDPVHIEAEAYHGEYPIKFKGMFSVEDITGIGITISGFGKRRIKKAKAKITDVFGDNHG